jgi:hypothetical protein
VLSTESPWAYDCSFDDTEIHVSLEKLLRLSSLKDIYWLCFFIDALYELGATHQQNHRDLLNLLVSWCQAVADALKICVSSREDNVFMNNLESARGFCLQDLTRDDMTYYCLDRLHVSEKSEERRYLAHKVIDQSEGVFLWVVLAVNDVHHLREDGS